MTWAGGKVDVIVCVGLCFDWSRSVSTYQIDIIVIVDFHNCRDGRDILKCRGDVAERKGMI